MTPHRVKICSTAAPMIVAFSEKKNPVSWFNLTFGSGNKLGRLTRSLIYLYMHVIRTYISIEHGW